MLAILTLIGAIVGLIAGLVQIFKDGPSVVRRALGLPERIDPATVAAATARGSAPSNGSAGSANLGGLASGVALGGVSVALAAEVLAHHAGHGHDVATATGDLLASADATLMSDLQNLPDLPIDAASDVLGAIGEFLRS